MRSACLECRAQQPSGASLLPLRALQAGPLAEGGRRAQHTWMIFSGMLETVKPYSRTRSGKMLDRILRSSWKAISPTSLSQASCFDSRELSGNLPLFRWASFRSSSRMLFRAGSATRGPRVSLTEAGEDEVRGGEWGLRGGEWVVGEGKVGEWCIWVEGWWVFEGT